MKHKTYLLFKRLFDIFIGLIGTVFLVPIALLIKLAYLCSGDSHPIFFTQDRIGKDGKIFHLHKFRSMIYDADDELARLMEKNKKIKKEYETNKKLKNDPRVTKVGGFIRRFSIDETPQFLNVLLGDMSLIGNRPYLPREKKDMKKYYKEIIKTKPGISGLWQVSGHNDVSFKSRLEVEALYSEQQCFSLDLHIFFKTFAAVIQGDRSEKH